MTTPLRLAQARAARVTVVVTFCAIGIIVALRLWGAAHPPWWVLFGLGGALAVLYWRRRETWVAYPIAIAMPVFARPETDLTLLIVPVAIAALVGSRRTMIWVVLLTHGVWLAIGHEAPPTSYALAVVVIATSLYAVRRVLSNASGLAQRASGLFDALAEETNEVISITGPREKGEGAFYVSPSVSRVLGYSADEFREHGWANLIHPDDLPSVMKMSGDIRLAAGNTATSQFRLRHRDGEFRWIVARGTNLIDNRHVGGVLSTFMDVTSLVEERQAAEERTAFESLHDPSTGLPNARQLHERLKHAIAALVLGHPTTMLFVDIDGFKLICDTHGHDFGDALVTEIAGRFRSELPEHAELFRFGGDELILIVPASELDAQVTANQLLTMMAKPFHLPPREVFVTVSIGIATIRADHDSPSAVLKDADLAVYRAKEKGKNRWERFDLGMRDTSTRRHQLEQALRSAVRAGELRLVYQPKSTTEGRRITGFEALLRWDSASLGSVSPMEFIPVAEETGLIEEIGRWVLFEACKQLAEWQARSPALGGLRMAINLSGRQLLANVDIADVVREAIDEHGLSPWTIELEITESVLMKNAERAVSRLEKLKALGVKLSIDDFGTGYSSLSYLRRFPVDVLKVDRAFVLGLGTSKEDSAIVHLVITLAKGLGLSTVAEGVETQLQLDELTALGCEQIQGYLLSRPLAPRDALLFLDRHFGIEEVVPAAE